YLKITTNPNPGLSYGLQLDLLTHGILGYVYSFKGSYYELIRNIVQYMNVRAPLLKMSTHQERAFFSVQIHCGEFRKEIRHFMLQTFTARSYKLGSLLVPNIHIRTQRRLFHSNTQLKAKIPPHIVENSDHNELRYYTDTSATPLPEMSLEASHDTAPD